MSTTQLIHADAHEALRDLPDNSVDALVTDPPAGIEFMGKEWDSFSGDARPPGVDNPETTSGPHNRAKVRHGTSNGYGNTGAREGFIDALTPIFRECLRVMKPGAWGAVWALPRTSHWTATALENAGFEVRERVAHLFGTGFPKSLNVSKAIDARAGAVREVVGYDASRARPNRKYKSGALGNISDDDAPESDRTDNGATQTAPATDLAKQFDGYGTALKPACEDWWLVRKPLIGTVAENVEKYGTGGINIDGCRVAHASEADRASATPQGAATGKKGALAGGVQNDVARTEFDRPDTSKGRWPANVVLSHDDRCVEVGTRDVRVVGATAHQAHHSTTSAASVGTQPHEHPGFRNTDGTETVALYACVPGCPVRMLDDQKASASRFFYVAKPSKKEKGAGAAHPTVKGIELMRWLIRLVSPPGDALLLDPFAGSGTIGLASRAEGKSCILIEREAEYAAIIKDRLAEDAPLLNLAGGAQ